MSDELFTTLALIPKSSLEVGKTGFILKLETVNCGLGIELEPVTAILENEGTATV